MEVLDVQSLGFEASETLLFRVNEVPDTPQEWAENLHQIFPAVLGELAIGGPRLIEHPDPNIAYSMQRRSDGSQWRDWWAGDHFWHVDGTRWPVQPVLTGSVCKEAAGPVPGTELLDTVKLLQISLDDKFWAKRGLNDHDLDYLKVIFADSTYQRQAMPYLRPFMTQQEQDRLQQITAIDIAKANAELLGAGVDRTLTSDEDLADYIDEKYPPKEFHLIRTTPFSGHDSLFLDAGGRAAELVDLDTRQDMTSILRDFRWEYLAGDTPRRLGLTSIVDWEPGVGVIFPQVGTLHRALPGNDVDRSLHLAFLSQARFSALPNFPAPPAVFVK
ncbi:MAG TPA: hypothetical protein VG604_03275 [Candidatus Saccharimonadales bacterium]|nr:hypothetical protein [Candidatus Saccharimonadales bacterium]